MANIVTIAWNLFLQHLNLDNLNCFSLILSGIDAECRNFWSGLASSSLLDIKFHFIQLSVHSLHSTPTAKERTLKSIDIQDKFYHISCNLITAQSGLQRVEDAKCTVVNWNSMSMANPWMDLPPKDQGFIQQHSFTSIDGHTMASNMDSDVASIILWTVCWGLPHLILHWKLLYMVLLFCQSKWQNLLSKSHWIMNNQLWIFDLLSCYQ